MSDSSKLIENVSLHPDDGEEPLDPRIQIELERANGATIEINNLETQLDNAQKLFQTSFNNCKQRLATLAQKLGRCVERARPYYDVCKQAEEAQVETQKAAQEYQNSVELYHTAQENLLHAESKLSDIDSLTRQEYVTHVKMKVAQAEQDKVRCEQTHEENSKLYQEYEQQRIALSRSLTRTINKSKSYFQEKAKAEKELKNQKVRIEDVQKAIMQAKRTYRIALNNLEQISEEIHSKRQNQLAIKLLTREPGVGAEKPDEFLEFPSLELTEFPKIDLSDDSSDNEISNSMNSLAINTSTNCLHTFAHSLSPLPTNKCANQFSTQSNGCVTDPRRGKYIQSDKKLKIKSTRVNETPLLSHLIGTHKFHSDSSLNVRTKH